MISLEDRTVRAQDIDIAHTDRIGLQLAAHGHLAQGLLQARQLFVPRVGLARLQARFARREEHFAPFRKLGGCQTQFTRNRVQIFSTQQPQHRFALRLCRPTTTFQFNFISDTPFSTHCQNRVQKIVGRGDGSSRQPKIILRRAFLPLTGGNGAKPLE